MSEETKLKISVALKGNRNGGWRAGSHHTVESKRKMRIARLGRKFGPQKAAHEYADNYQAAHIWMRRHFTKSGMCEICLAERVTYWSNISGTYRRVREDYWELCVPCHKLFDYLLAIEKADPVHIEAMKAKRLLVA